MAGERRTVCRFADHQSPAGLPRRLSQSRPRLCSTRRTVRRGRHRRGDWCGAVVARVARLPAPACGANYENLLGESDVFSALIDDWRLGLEVSVINTLAHRLTRMLMTRDPLCDPVHLKMPAVAGLTLAAVCSGAARRLGRRPSADAPNPPRRQVTGKPPRRRNARPAARSPPACAAAQARARGDVRHLCLLPRGRRHRRRPDQPDSHQRGALQAWRDDLDALYRGGHPARAARGGRGAPATICCARIFWP